MSLENTNFLCGKWSCLVCPWVNKMWTSEQLHATIIKGIESCADAASKVLARDIGNRNRKK